MLITRRVQVEKEEIVDIICDMCGKSVSDPWMKAPNNYAILEIHWGFGSPNDTQIHRSHLCQDCYRKIVEEFKIRVTITHELMEAVSLDGLKEES